MTMAPGPPGHPGSSTRRPDTKRRAQRGSRPAPSRPSTPALTPPLSSTSSTGGEAPGCTTQSPTSIFSPSAGEAGQVSWAEQSSTANTWIGHGPAAHRPIANWPIANWPITNWPIPWPFARRLMASFMNTALPRLPLRRSGFLIEVASSPGSSQPCSGSGTDRGGCLQ